MDGILDKKLDRNILRISHGMLAIRRKRSVGNILSFVFLIVIIELIASLSPNPGAKAFCLILSIVLLSKVLFRTDICFELSTGMHSEVKRFLGIKYQRREVALGPNYALAVVNRYSYNSGFRRKNGYSLVATSKDGLKCTLIQSRKKKKLNEIKEWIHSIGT